MSSASARVPAWPQPSPRLLLAACAAPLVALALWFGVVDRVPFGDGRCASCGVEGYVIALHAVAAVCLSAVVGTASALRRLAREGVGAPGPVTAWGLGAGALFAVASMVWHVVFTPLALAALAVSLVLLPAAAIWWLAATVLWRRAPETRPELLRRLDLTLATAWVSLAILLPAIFTWVWLDRVEWLVF
jgi:hypothetical protein